MTIRTTIFTVAAAVTVLGAASLSPRPAAAEISSLEECYNTVINWCKDTFPDHADECGSASGLNDCDDEFGETRAPKTYDRIRILVGPGRGDRLPELKLQLVEMPARPAGDDRDTGRSRDSVSVAGR